MPGVIVVDKSDEWSLWGILQWFIGPLILFIIFYYGFGYKFWTIVKWYLIIVGIIVLVVFGLWYMSTSSAIPTETLEN